LTPVSDNTYNPADSCNYHTVTLYQSGWREEENMLRIVSLQLIATAVAGLVAALLGGAPAAVSAMLGGLFALRLFASARRGQANPGTFFIGEFIKIAMTLALLGAAVWLYHDLNWLALLCGFIVALKSYIILLFRH
jgi:ATP synthase protein I